MATTTANLIITKNAYVKVSDGGNNCTMVISTGEVIRIIIGTATQPLVNATNYIPMSGPGTSSPRGGVFSIEGLGTDELWVRAEDTDVSLGVIRGSAMVRIADATSQ